MALYCKCGKLINEKLHNSMLISNFEPSMCFDCIKSYYGQSEEIDKPYINDFKFLDKIKSIKQSNVRLKVYND